MSEEVRSSSEQFVSSFGFFCVRVSDLQVSVAVLLLLVLLPPNSHCDPVRRVSCRPSQELRTARRWSRCTFPAPPPVRGSPQEVCQRQPRLHDLLISTTSKRERGPPVPADPQPVQQPHLHRASAHTSPPGNAFQVVTTPGERNWL